MARKQLECVRCAPEANVERASTTLCLANRIALLKMMVLLMLLHHLVVTEGAECPTRRAYVPDLTTGFPYPSEQLDESSDLSIVNNTRLVWEWPDVFQQDCCSSGRIVEWTVTTTSEYGLVARVNASCSNGEEISTPLYGYNYYYEEKFCSNDTGSSESVIQPDNEGVFTYVSIAFTTLFMGVGNDLGYSRDVTSCPLGTRAVGIGARSACYGLQELQVICAKIAGTLQSVGTASTGLGTNRDDHCSSSSPASSNNETLIVLADSKSDQLNTSTDCCPRGEGIANWTVVQTNYYLKTYTALGLIQGRCTDGTLLAPVLYGYNGTNDDGDDTYCNDQRLLNTFHYNTPISQRFSFSYSSLRNDGFDQPYLLRSFISPASSNKSSEEIGNSYYKSFLSCPSGEGAVGYTAASSCYSLTSVSVLCSNLSDTAWATLNEYGSTEADPPADAEAGVCPGGIGMEPISSVSDPQRDFIGELGPFYISPIRSSALNPGVPIYTGQASTRSSSCCPSGHAITGFNVWPSDNILLLVGKVSAVCSPYLDGSQPTNSSEIAYGFNGTDSSNKTAFCPNATTGDMKSIPLVKGNWTYRSGWNFESLMEWPYRTSTNAYGFFSNMSTASCPSGQQPIAFSARSSCWALADFRVICGKVDLKTNPANIDDVGAGTIDSIGPGISSTTSSTGLSTGAKAGIAVGAVAAAAIVALLAGFIFFRRHQRHKSKISTEKSDLETLHCAHAPTVPTEYLSGATTASSLQSSQDSRAIRGVPYIPRFLEKPSSSNAFGGPSEVSAVLFSEVAWRTEVAHMEDIDLPPKTGTSQATFESLPLEWKIPMSSVKLLCRGDRPIVLGKGGYGMVYRAIVRKNDAAIKVVTGGGEDEQARLLHEITILEQCKCVSIVQFLGYSISEDGLLLCMEYMSGGTLFSALRRNDEFQWYNRGWQAMRAVAAGLYFLHERNVAHLDLKTPNILIGSDKKVKIADMGLGKLVKGNETQASQLGTIAWMAPEVLLKGTCALQSDVWSFSTILWEVCTLRKPAYALKVDDIAVPEEAPQELVALIHECRAENYWERPSMEVVCDRLDNIPNSL